MRLTFTLPLPPSSNHRLQPMRAKKAGEIPRLVLAADHREWMASAPARIRRQLPADWRPLAGPVRVVVLVYLDTLASDLGNREKCLFDAATQAGVWDDDRQVADLRMLKAFTAPGQAAEVRVLVEPAQGFEDLERRLEESRKRKAAEARREQAKTPASRVAQIPGLFEAQRAPRRALAEVARVVAGITGDRPRRLTRSDAARLAVPNVKRHKR